MCHDSSMRASIVLAMAALVAGCADNGGGTLPGDASTSVTCKSGTNVPTSTGCRRTFTGCSDGHVYAIECASTACTCFVDSTALGKPNQPTCDGADFAAVADNCGFAR